MKSKLFLQFLKFLKFSVPIIGTLSLLWYAFALIGYGHINPNNPLSLLNASYIGSFVGGFVGIFFVILGVILLYETLSLQRQELSQSRKIFNRQQFETTLFNLLNAQREIVNQIEYLEKEEKQTRQFKSRQFFVLIEEEIRTLFSIISEEKIEDSLGPDQYFLLKIFEGKLKKAEKEETPDKLRFITKELNKIKRLSQGEQIRMIYKLMFDHYHGFYGHYFRLLYHILKMIEEKEKTELSLSSENTSFELNQNDIIKTYQKYADIVQATLSSAELFVLFYNGLCFKEMKKLLHHFNFLENLAVEDLLCDAHKEFYSKCKIDGNEFPEILFKSRDNL